MIKLDQFKRSDLSEAKLENNFFLQLMNCSAENNILI